MSKVIYVCKTEEEFKELCSIFDYPTDVHLNRDEAICLRVENDEAICHDSLSWYKSEEEYEDYKFIKCFEGTLKESYDDVKSPKHYKLEGLEPYQSVDIINSILKSVKDPVRAFRVGNALKYLIRAEKKNGLEDYKKARVYLDWIIEEMEE